MRASQSALDRCTEVIAVLNSCMNELNEIRFERFDTASESERSLASETLRVLLNYQFERSSGVYSLIANRMVWDAEIVLRSVYETSAKVMFIGAHHKSAQDDLIAEFWGDLSAIYDRKGAERAHVGEKLRKRYAEDGDDIRIFRHLQNPAFLRRTQSATDLSAARLRTVGRFLE